MADKYGTLAYGPITRAEFRRIDAIAKRLDHSGATNVMMEFLTPNLLISCGGPSAQGYLTVLRNHIANALTIAPSKEYQEVSRDSAKVRTRDDVRLTRSAINNGR